jgi:hypothetical protein
LSGDLLASGCFCFRALKVKCFFATVSGGSDRRSRGDRSLRSLPGDCRVALAGLRPPTPHRYAAPYVARPRRTRLHCTRFHCTRPRRTRLHCTRSSRSRGKRGTAPPDGLDRAWPGQLRSLYRNRSSPFTREARHRAALQRCTWPGLLHSALLRDAASETNVHLHDHGRARRRPP